MVALAVMLLVPANGLAVDRFVDDNGLNAPGCTDSEAPCKTIKHAVSEAADGDTIFIDEGTYEESILAQKRLTFVGDGSGTPSDPGGATIVRGPDGVGAAGGYAFAMAKGGTLRALRAEGGAGGTNADTGYKGGQGVSLGGTLETSLRLESVLAMGGDAGSGANSPPGGAGLYMEGFGGELDLVAEDSEFVSGSALGTSEPSALVGGESANGRFVDSTFGGFVFPLRWEGIRVRTEADVIVEGGLALAKKAAVVEGGTASFDGTALAGELNGLDAFSFQPQRSADASLRNSIVFAENGDAAVARTSPSSDSASISSFGSTLIGQGGAGIAVDESATGGAAVATLHNSIARSEPFNGETPIDLRSDGGQIEAEFSSFSTFLELNGGTTTAPGSANNISGSPGFADGSGPLGELAPGSPLVDRADPAGVQTDELDFGGEPRSLDGNGDCIAVPDIGAWELTGHDAPCSSGSPAPSATVAAIDPLPRVDAFGMTNRVFAPNGRSKASPRRASASDSKAKRGTTFSYTLSEPAKVAITIERKARGRKINRDGGSRCVRPRRGKAKPRCVRWIRVGTLSARKQAGRQATPFSGRIRGRALKPGRYRGRIVATDAAGQTSSPRQAGFRVVSG